MAFVLTPPPTPPLDSISCGSVYNRSVTLLSEIGTVQHLVLRDSSPASFMTARPPQGLQSRSSLDSCAKRLNVGHQSLRLFRDENCPAVDLPTFGDDLSPLYLSPPSNSPRRSWSWNVTGDHANLKQVSSCTVKNPLVYNRTIPVAQDIFSSHRGFEHDLLDSSPYVHVNTPSDFSESLVYVCPQTTPPSSLILQPDCIEIEQPNLFDTNNDAHAGHTKVVNALSPPTYRPTSPFKRWLKSLRRRESLKSHAAGVVLPENSQSLAGPIVEIENLTNQAHGHRRTPSSASSGGFLSAMKTASVTVASASLYPHSRRSMIEDPQVELPDGRRSYEISSLLDDGTFNRSVQRNRIVEELISSEESYVRDLKTLLNVYLTVLPRNIQDRRVVRRAVSQILQLHEELINKLIQLQQQHKITVINAVKPSRLVQRGGSRHIRWRSWDTGNPVTPAVSRRDKWTRHSIDTSQPVLIQPKVAPSDTRLVLDIAKLFDQFMFRFLTYEAYAAYNDLIGESDVSLRTNGWQEAEKGIEALSVLALPASQRLMDEKKALSFADLIIKPVQRICKYPLFFNDLSRHTPACDDPVAHAELEKVLVRLQKVTEEVDLAMSSLEVRKRIEASWILQQRFEFQDMHLNQGNIMARLGHVILCGTLHVVYLGQEGVKGEYIVCALYRSSLVIAVIYYQQNQQHAHQVHQRHPNQQHPAQHHYQYPYHNRQEHTIQSGTASQQRPGQDHIYQQQASEQANGPLSPKKYRIFSVIPLVNASIEDADNGRGLQCHTAQFTFKLVFEMDRRQQEILLSACSEAEENCWKSQLRSRIYIETSEYGEGREKFEAFPIAHLGVKTHGISGRRGAGENTNGSSSFFTNFSRRLSVQRAATVGAKSNVQQVIVKNTECPRYTNNNSSITKNTTAVARSQSYMSSSHIPILTPRRQDRVKLEMSMSDVWTKTLLPYPGMSSNRMESTIRASANHVMRKLSIASMTSMTSIASTFSKRSMSFSGTIMSGGSTTSGSSGAGGTVGRVTLQRPATACNESRSVSASTACSGQSTRTLRGPTDKRKRAVLVDFHNTPKAFLPEDFELDLDLKLRRSGGKRLGSVGRLSMMMEGSGDGLEGCGNGTLFSNASRPNSSSTIRVVALDNTDENESRTQIQSLRLDASREVGDEPDTIGDVSCHAGQILSTPAFPSRSTTSGVQHHKLDGRAKGSSNGQGHLLGHRRLARTTKRVLMRLFT